MVGNPAVTQIHSCGSDFETNPELFCKPTALTNTIKHVYFLRVYDIDFESNAKGFVQQGGQNAVT